MPPAFGGVAKTRKHYRFPAGASQLANVKKLGAIYHLMRILYIVASANLREFSLIFLAIRGDWRGLADKETLMRQPYPIP